MDGDGEEDPPIVDGDEELPIEEDGAPIELVEGEL
jgi:hypothetical protein